MPIVFKPENHVYESVDQENPIQWTSVTSLVHLFKEPFDAPKVAEKASKNRKSKWYKMSVDEILSHWNDSNKIAVSLGSWYHDQREQDLIACDTIQRSGRDLSIVSPLVDGDNKFAPDQALTEGIYPEHLVYLKSAGICGQADRVEVVGDTINLYDYKTNKEIKTKGYKHWDGRVEKMLHCLAHVDDCNFMHYALQLSTYMYIMLKHNPNLKPGVIQLEHIIFETDGDNGYGVPNYVYDPQGDPIVKEVVKYDLPFMKKEVRAMIKYIQSHPEILKK